MWHINYVQTGTEEVWEETGDTKYTTATVKPEASEELSAKLFLLGCYLFEGNWYAPYPDIFYKHNPTDPMNQIAWWRNNTRVLLIDLTLMRRLIKRKGKNETTCRI